MEVFSKNPQFILAEKICKQLSEQGFQSYLAGGCVRDFLLHRSPADFDVASQATPDQVEALFEKTLSVGKKFGVMVVIEGDCQVEVATFRKDGPYQDGRHPSSVEFSDAQEDARRRDFTINALFYDLKTRQVIDHVQGLQDLKAKKIRAVGDPLQRFQEDQLRVLRALRFSAQLGFEIETSTWKACETMASGLHTVSGERVQEELSKLLAGDFVREGLELLFKSSVLGEILGEKHLLWKPLGPYWARAQKSKEDLWFRFFVWVFFSVALGTSIYFFEELCNKWKFSRDLKGKSLRSLQWFYENKPFLQRPFGELLALSYEPEHDRGLREYAELLLQPEEVPFFEKFLQRKQALGPHKPEAWVKASDLPPTVQGADLGQALKQCYFLQLEGVASSQQELLQIWNQKS